jgi:2-succinyl-5-enolpyruvyl-6-hydroxy-3-cyclohexene-1-carboxylate synthase
MQSGARALMIQEHPHDFAHWAAQWHLVYHRIAAMEDLDAFEPSEKMTVLEVRPDAQQTQEFWQKWDRFQ